MKLENVKPTKLKVGDVIKIGGMSCTIRSLTLTYGRTYSDQVRVGVWYESSSEKTYVTLTLYKNARLTVYRKK